MSTICDVAQPVRLWHVNYLGCSTTLHKEHQMNNHDYKPYYHRDLPHIQPLGATFFITFRLAGSIPRSVLQQWKTENLHFLKSRNEIRAAGQKQKHRELEWKRKWFRRFEETLDNAQIGPVWLKDDRIAKEVAASLHYRDGKVYRLEAYCIMANHVHVVFTPLPIQSEGVEQTACLPANDNDAQPNRLCYNSLSFIMQSLKGYTARKANQLLGRSGRFWQHESHDHCVRNPNELKRIINYVLNNPVKAGLAEDWEKWQWSYYRTSNS